MTSILCDSCKKAISNGVREVNYVTITDKNLCLDCEKKLETMIREHMAKQDKYSIEVYKQATGDLLTKICR